MVGWLWRGFELLLSSWFIRIIGARQGKARLGLAHGREKGIWTATMGFWNGKSCLELKRR